MEARPSPAKLIYIALDGCDTPTMLDLAAKGRCPNIAALLKVSAVADTVAPSGTYVGSIWMTISTGCDVSTHRYWNWAVVDPVTYEVRGTTPRESERGPFWEALSEAGKRVAVLDVPHSMAPAQ